MRGLGGLGRRLGALRHAAGKISAGARAAGGRRGAEFPQAGFNNLRATLRGGYLLLKSAVPSTPFGGKESVCSTPLQRG